MVLHALIGRYPQLEGMCADMIPPCNEALGAYAGSSAVGLGREEDAKAWRDYLDRFIIDPRKL